MGISNSADWYFNKVKIKNDYIGIFIIPSFMERL